MRGCAVAWRVIEDGSGFSRGGKSWRNWAQCAAMASERLSDAERHRAALSSWSGRPDAAAAASIRAGAAWTGATRARRRYLSRRAPATLRAKANAVLRRASDAPSRPRAPPPSRRTLVRLIGFPIAQLVRLLLFDVETCGIHWPPARERLVRATVFPGRIQYKRERLRGQGTRPARRTNASIIVRTAWGRSRGKNRPLGNSALFFTGVALATVSVGERDRRKMAPGVCTASRTIPDAAAAIGSQVNKLNEQP